MKGFVFSYKEVTEVAKWIMDNLKTEEELGEDVFKYIYPLMIKFVDWINLKTNDNLGFYSADGETIIQFHMDYLSTEDLENYCGYMQETKSFKIRYDMVGYLMNITLEKFKTAIFDYLFEKIYFYDNQDLNVTFRQLAIDNILLSLREETKDSDINMTGDFTEIVLRSLKSIKK